MRCEEFEENTSMRASMVTPTFRESSGGMVSHLAHYFQNFQYLPFNFVHALLICVIIKINYCLEYDSALIWP